MKSQGIAPVGIVDKSAAIRKYSANDRGYAAYRRYGDRGGGGRQQDSDGYVPTPFRREDAQEDGGSKAKQEASPEFYAILKKSLEDKNKMNFAAKIRTPEITGQTAELKYSIEWALELTTGLTADKK